ncbi:unnamed protein product [Cuscuta campestris]|uniref:Uncharacterized protein n=1 Tax=Cuscuta campestris TaxID=132261 RepID=A0A484MWE4_9ASTE|nr:unnamed protein product [Cuscuta campestris]
MEEGEQIDLEIKDHSISNVSLENDNFVLNLSSSQLLQAISLNQPENQKEPICLELFENIEGQEESDTYPCDEKDDTFPEICETIEPESPKWKGNFKFRESLAWDSAFFTDAGVLEPEELSRMIKRTENGDKHDLFGIDEDVEQSTGSFTIYGSDDLNFWQLKTDSCEDIKASTNESCKLSNLMISSSHVTSSKEVNEATSALNEVDYTKNKLVPKVSPKRTIGAQTSRVSKSQQKQFCAIQGSGKSVAETSSQLMQANTRTTDSKSFLGSSKRTSKVNSVSAAAGKGTTRDAKHFKMVHANGKLSTGSSNGTEAPKVVPLNNARKVLLKPATSVRPPSIGSSASTRNVSRSSSSSTASTLSDRTAKSTSSVARKVESKSVGRPAVNTPSQIPLKNDVSLRNSAVGAYVMSSKMSPGISPGSSLTSCSEWSSTSSTSRSINKRSNGSRTSLDTSRSVDSYSPASDLSNHPSQRHTSAKSVTRTALRSGSVSKPLRQNTLSQAASKKPSCLRMPSPEIGFFDADKSPSMLSPSNPSVAVTKLGANIRANLKTKTAELPNAKTLNVSVSTECDTEKVPSQESRDGSLCPKHAAGDLIKSKTSTICLKH